MANLPITSASGLSYENILTDIYNMVNDNPDYQDNWDDFLASNAGRMLLELFSYIAEQLALRIDITENENFLDTARKIESVIRIIKEIGYDVSLPTCARVDVTLTINDNIGLYYLSRGYDEITTDFDYKKITATDRNGNQRYFEAINYDDVAEEFNYKNSITIDTTDTYDEDGSIDPVDSSSYYTQESIPFYEGVTRNIALTAETNSGQIFTIEEVGIIKNSITIYLKTEDGYTRKLLKVGSFLERDAQNEDTEIPFTVKNINNEKVEITFPTLNVIPKESKILPQNSELLLFYRIGGGTIGNIPKKSINLTENNISNTGNKYTITYINYLSGYGGKNIETIDEIKYNAPNSIKSNKTTVTREDYEYHLNQNQYINTSITYGQGNLPSNYKNKIGQYMSPLDAVNFIVALRKTNLENISTDIINDINLCTFNEENRFNEEISFREGKLGHSYTLTGMTYIEEDITNPLNLVYTTLPSQTTYYNVYELEAPEELLDAIIADTTADGYPRFTFTQAAPTESKLENFSVDAPSVLSSSYYTSGTTKTYTPIFEEDYGEFRLSEDINPVLVGTIDLSEGINVDTNKQFNIDIDGDVHTIDLTGLSGTIDLTTLVGEINNIFDSIGESFASQRFGLTIYNTSDFIISEIMNQDEDNYYLNLSDAEYTIFAGTTQTYAQLLSNINTALSGSKYSARFVSVYDSALETTTCADIEIYNNGTISGQKEDDVIIEMATIPAYDLLAALGTESNTSLEGENSLRTTYQENYNIASVVDDKYLKLEIDGTVNEFISLVGPINNDLTEDIFGVNFSTEAEYRATNYKRITTFIDDTSGSESIKFLYETGSPLPRETINTNIFLNYITAAESGNFYEIGSFYANKDSGDVLKRNPVRAIYNTVYDTDDHIDTTLSDFQVKFTKDKVISSSFYGIDELDNITLAQKPKLTVDENFTAFYIDGSTTTTQTMIIKVYYDDGSGSQTNTSYNFEITDGETLNDFKIAIDESNLKDHATITVVQGDVFIIEAKDNNYLIDKIEITNAEASSIESQVFIEVPSETQRTIVRIYTSYVTGDYYIKYTEGSSSSEVEDGRFNIEAIPDNEIFNNNFPDGTFYIHFVEDKRHIDSDGNKFSWDETDEDIFSDYLDDKKIVGVENYFKQPVFKVFDLKITIRFSQALYRQKNTIEQNLITKITNLFSISNGKIGENIYKSDIYTACLTINGVERVSINFLGTDFQNSSTAVNETLEIDFDEVGILSENKYIYIDNSKIQTHGLIIEESRIF